MDEELSKFEFQLARFGQALAALQDAVDTDTGDKKSRDSILLSFVFTFEMAWKTLKALLIEKGALPPDYATGVLKAAFTVGLLPDADLWMDLRDARNEVSHAYDLEKAIEIATLVRSRGMDGFHALKATLHADAG